MENLLDISFEAIRYFLSVAKYGSISKAANVLKISQSALSQSMKNLEEHLGITLFNRNTRGVILTEEGKVLFEEAREGEKFFRKAIVNAKQNANFRLSGTFKISCSRAVFDFCFKSHMKNVLKAFPDLNIEFVKHFLEQDVVKALQNEEVDLCFVKSDKTFVLKEVECKSIMTLHYKLCYNPDYFSFPETVKLEDIKKYIIVVKTRTERGDSTWMEYSFPRTIICRDDLALLSMIKQGVGIGLFPVEFSENNGIKSVEVEGFKKVDRVVYACYNSTNKTAKEIVKIIKN